MSREGVGVEEEDVLEGGEEDGEEFELVAGWWSSAWSCVVDLGEDYACCV